MTAPNLDGTNAIVTGASRGIGRGVALLLAEHGANIALNHYRDDEQAATTAGEIEALGRKVHHAECDVSSPAAVRQFYADSVAALGEIDVLVNNAGHNITEYFEDITEESFDRMHGVHVKGTFFMTQAVYTDMKARGAGRIINVTSQLGYKGAGLLTHYAGAKGANITFTRSLALEAADNGVLVNHVAPGVTHTDLLSPLSTELLDGLRATIPMGRFAEVDEIAPAVLFLASPQGSFFHGTCISPNGGEVML